MISKHRVRYSARSHVGYKRVVNEDSVLALPEEGLWLVADGMGGHEAGDYASRVVADMVASIPPNLSPPNRLGALREALARAHAVIRQEAASRGGGTIGTTVACLILAKGYFAGLWAGDSRIYLLRGDEFQMLSSDHSVVAEFVLTGQMTWDEAEQHPQSNAITRAVGVGEELELDKVRGRAKPGDRFLICSDGLSKYATFPMLESALKKMPIETVADQLVQVALEGGGADNITVVVVDIL